MNIKKIILISLLLLLVGLPLKAQELYPDTVKTLISTKSDFIVYFYAPWAPVDSIKTNEYPIIYLSIDECREWVLRETVLELPYILLYKKGVVVYRTPNPLKLLKSSPLKDFKSKKSGY